MKDQKDINDVLSSVQKTVQMGQIGIRSIREYDMDSRLKNDIESQGKEFDSIEKEVEKIAQKYHLNISEIHPAIRYMSGQMAKVRLSRGNHNSKIAEMMIRGNMTGMIKNLRVYNESKELEHDAREIVQKLIRTESANIQQMKQYL